MAMKRIDRRPRNHGECNAKAKQFATNFTKELRGRIGCATGTPLGDYIDTRYTPGATRVIALYPKWEELNTRTPIVVMELNEAEAAFLPVYHEVQKLMIAHPLVTNEDLVLLGFHPRPSGERHVAPVETRYPWYRSSTPRVGCIEIEYGNIEDGGKKKPAGQHGIECRWGILPGAPADASGLHDSEFDTHTPLVLNFPGQDRGKTVYFALRWENSRGLKGPFGPIESAVIP
jgi:hypothetical protein